jgi:hypothetical protein
VETFHHNLFVCLHYLHCLVNCLFLLIEAKESERLCNSKKAIS